ncbi:MAG TPA: hypothetical protein VLG50_02325 [Candidatus Saccharimonadales bacterium]|nr:hypothetical protein [Candidatus Saccharimonadales bacterium]
MKKQKSSTFLLCGVFAMSLQAFDPDYDYSKSIEQNKARVDAKKQQEAILRQKQEADRIEATQKQTELEERQRKNREDAEEIRLRREGKPVPTRISDKPFVPFWLRDSKNAESVTVKVPEKSVGDQLIDSSNEFFNAKEINEKESLAKKLLKLPEDENLTAQRITSAFNRQVMQLRKNVEDFSTQELVQNRIDQARQFLIGRLDATKTKTIQSSSFETLTKPVKSDRSQTVENQSVEDNKLVQDNKMIKNKRFLDEAGEFLGKYSRKISRWWSSWGEQREKNYVNTIITQVLDDKESPDIFNNEEIQTNLQKMINEGKTLKEKQEIRQIMKSEIKKIVDERNIGLPAASKEKIGKIASQLIIAIDPKVVEPPISNAQNENEVTDSGW